MHFGLSHHSDDVMARASEDLRNCGEGFTIKGGEGGGHKGGRVICGLSRCRSENDGPLEAPVQRGMQHVAVTSGQSVQ
jgi:hypothetical protein